jgi:predicted RNase H-related nuclease YkuK (DUF458 family)
MTTRWKTINDDPIEDIVKWVEEATKGGQEIHVGTDSLQAGKRTQFVTVVVIHTPMKGGRVAYAREIVPRISSLRERLNKEVWKSIEVALVLPELPELTVHIDANPDERHMSSKYLQELAGMVMGQGFKAAWKPESWAATHAADHCVRFKNQPFARKRRRLIKEAV